MTEPAKTIRTCERCRKPFDAAQEEISFAPDPYEHEAHGDDTPVWLCWGCRDELAAKT